MRASLAVPDFATSRTMLERISAHLGHPVRQVLLVRRVLNDRHGESVKEPERLSRPAYPDTLDHLLMRDTEGIGFLPEQEREED